MNKLPETRGINKRVLNHIKKTIELDTGLKIIKIECLYMPIGEVEYLIRGLTENKKFFNFPCFIDESEIEDSISEICKKLKEVA